MSQGTALYVGAILGAGILALPSLAAEEAGPASVLAWALLLLFCVPVAASFAALSAHYPDGGGVATFVSKAYGRRASAMVGYWFYFALPAGAPVTAYVGGQYVAEALGGGRGEALVIAIALLTMAFGTNAIGLRVSGRVQLILVGLLAVLLLVACLLALPDAEAGNMTPFAPHGLLAVGPAASLLFFSFAGWEAVTHLAGEFRNPARDLRLVTALTLVVIAVLYIGLAVTCVLVLGPRLAASDVPLSLLLEEGIGDGAAAVTATLAAMLTFGTMNAYLAGAGRLGAALARDGALPEWLAKGHRPGEIPRRSLALLAVLSAVVSVVALAVGADLGSVMLAASACFIAVTVAGLVAGVRLLPTRRPVWYGAVVAAVVMGVVLAFSGVFLVIPLALAGAALWYTRERASRRWAPVPLPRPVDADPRVTDGA
ncbi:APC family permease [Streptomyces sp. NBC_01803]|uniref:APC family permease n=1 Tax=Streptomyces sp. NBC_01803 TaxID=2975946 RepID=UPI002DDB3319|nr:APC family permease [Streptomyces sp. NBC_01803]WSA43130.1 APC family permease [Streptomyces sp. NBC_01803]